MSTTAVEA